MPVTWKGLIGRAQQANQRFNGILGGLTPRNNAGGLLSDPEAEDARRQGQLMSAASLLQSAGPSTMPSLGLSNFASGLAAGQIAQNQALDTALKRLLVASESAHNLAPGRTELGTVTLESNGQQRTLRRADPQVDALLQRGWTEVRTPASQVNINTGETAGNVLSPADVQKLGLPPTTIVQRKKNGDLDILNKPTEGEERNAYASQNLLAMNDAAEQVITDNPDFDPSSIMEPGLLPVVGDFVASQPYRQFKSAADEWTTNVVFLRSGATAREEEKSSAFKNYWPQPLDSDRTKARKELLRLEQMERAYEAGRAANRIGSNEADTVLRDIGARKAVAQRKIDMLKDEGRGPKLPPLPKGFTLDPE